MEFEDLDKAYEFYNRYARLRGFSVRKSSFARTDGKITYRRFVCSKEGTRKPDKRRENVENPRPETRENCPACMRVSLQENGKYMVTRFEAQHCHKIVSPSKCHFLKSQRKLSGVQAAQIELASQSGITPKQAYEMQSRQAGGRENLGFLHIDHKNYLRHKRRERMEQGVAGSMLEYHRRKQRENPACYFDFQLDCEGQITNFFWADARSIIDYGLFGDVVSFDTTYRTNDYGRPFAPFVGVNHHNQTIVFGAALLYDETADTFIWLFETFLEAMSGKQPQSIFTDQCQAMAKAITVVLPDTHHRLCTWHIYQNATKHLASVFHRSPQFKGDFKRCIYDFFAESDFLTAWDKMLNDYSLRDNSWLIALFKERNKWAMVYGRNTFCASLRSTQRSESFNSVLRKYMNSRLDPMRFFDQFERLVEDRRHEELQADFKSMNSKPALVIPCPILKQASLHYTLEVFALFQEEWRMSHAIEIHHVRDGEIGNEYRAIDHINHRENIVYMNNSDLHVWCNCCKFEFAGIQCSHVIKLLVMKNIFHFNPKYLLKRWSKDAKSNVVMNNLVIQEDTRPTTTWRYMDLCHGYIKIASRAAEHESTYLVAKELQALTLNRVDDAYREVLHHGDSEVNICIGVGVHGASEVHNDMDMQSDTGVLGFARKGKRRTGGSNLSRIKSSLEKAGNKKKPLRGVHRVLFDAPALLNMVCSSPLYDYYEL